MLAKTAETFPFHQSSLTPFAVAAAAVGGAVVLRLVLSPILTSHAPLLLFTLSVMVAARFGGVGPGLAATALSGIIGSYFFIEPYSSFRIGNVTDGAYLALFVVVGVGISLLNGQLLAALKLSAETVERYHTLSEAVPQLVWTARPTAPSTTRTRVGRNIPALGPRNRRVSIGWSRSTRRTAKRRVRNGGQPPGRDAAWNSRCRCGATMACTAGSICARCRCAMPPGGS